MEGCQAAAFVVQFARTAEVRLFRVFRDVSREWTAELTVHYSLNQSFVFGWKPENLRQKRQELDL